MADAHLWTGGAVFTGRRFHESLLIDGKEIVAVGSLSETRRLSPTGTEVHDLAGGMLIPGLIDAHLHLAELALAERGLDLARASSVADLVEGVRAWGSSHPHGPIVGRGWNLPSLASDQWPTRRDLDRASADRAVLLYHASGHAVIVNSAALSILGIGRDSPDPSGGRVGRERDGEPNGQLFENATTVAAELAHQAATADPAAFDSVARQLSSLGITSVGTMNTSATELAGLATCSARGGFRVRVRAYLSLARFAALRAGELDRLVPETEFLCVRGVKGFADGAFGTRTAWLFDPYRDDPSTSGMAVHSMDELVEGFRRARELGLTPAIHALGDRGVDRALDALEASRLRGQHSVDRLDHAGLVPRSLLPKLKRVCPIAVVQPSFVWSDHWLLERLGPDRSRYTYPFRTIRDAGLTLAGSSDAPFDALDPWRGLRAAVHRQSPDGRSANPSPSEALTVSEAFGMYTVGGARALQEKGLGELAPGGLADFVWVRAPDFERALEQGAAGVEETWVDGVRAHFTGAAGAGRPSANGSSAQGKR